MRAREAAAWVITSVVVDGRSLSAALPHYIERLSDPRERALLQELCYGVLRWWPRLQALAERLLHKPLKQKESDIQALLLIGIYQLLYMRVAEHAAVTETVNAVKALNKPWAAALLNAALRRLLRDKTALLAAIEQHDEGRYAHPPWLLQRLRHDWPTEWPQIVAANNERPPMTLRVNSRHCSREDYMSRLAEQGIVAHPFAHSSEGVVLDKPLDVNQLPGFAQGWVSVQDGGAQLVADLMALAPGQRILDACSAPGGKSCHLLEREPALREVVAIDKEASRQQRLQENLTRLQLTATVLVGDATLPQTWWSGVPFDRILVDAPCSATGVIRRHPDIKVLRRETDMAALAATQSELLRQLWPLLLPGGMLLYATCSVLKEENESPLRHFLAAQPTAIEAPITASWGVAATLGRQIFPGSDSMDGFYYARIVKSS